MKLKQFKSLLIFWSLVICALLSLGVTIWLSVDKIIMPSIVRLGDERKVPDLVNLDYKDASEKLQQLGFKIIKSEEKIDSKVTKGCIIEQNPRANSFSKEGRNVYVKVSLGKLPVSVPNLLEISPQDAKYRISEARLFLDTIYYDFSNDYPEGVVIGQSLDSDSKAIIGDSLYIVVSLGNNPSQYIVPDLIGLPFSEAVKEINKSGFSVGYITKIKDSNLIPDTVVRQYPESEVETNKGAEIELYIVTDEEDIDQGDDN